MNDDYFAAPLPSREHGNLTRCSRSTERTLPSRFMSPGLYHQPSLQAYLGSLEQSQWGWIDTKHAHLGVALRYSGGQNGDSTVIRFMCDPKTDGVNEGPTFVSGATQGAYLFQWNTSFACLK
eukprot:m.1094844 g.1094844  ORF g.1094844 m.1094844 type:complete len:122 (-) comp24303_c1_seq9:58-423(-)